MQNDTCEVNDLSIEFRLAKDLDDKRLLINEDEK